MNVFDKVKLSTPKSNWFDLSHDVKTTLDMGNAVPVLCTRAYAGERFKVGLEQLTRFAPMLAPVYNRFDIRFDSFFYPTRLVWERSGDFFRGGKDGNTDIPYPNLSLSTILRCFRAFCRVVEHADNSRQIPGFDGSFSLKGRNPLLGTLYDYLGLPSFDDVFRAGDFKKGSEFLDKVISSLKDNDIKIDIIPFLMYQGLYREYYIDEQFLPNYDGRDDLGDYFANILEHADEFRYSDFDECLPDADIEDLIYYFTSHFEKIGLPNSDYVSDVRGVLIFSLLMSLRRVSFSKDYFTSCQQSPNLGPTVNIPIGDMSLYTGDRFNKIYSSRDTGVVQSKKSVDAKQSNIVRTDGSTNSTTIPDLRRANRLQEYLERSMLGGNRFIEWIKAHFGVTSSDGRLDRPEFLGRSKMPLTVSEVTQTTSDEENNVFLGDMAGHGISVHGDGLFDYTCEEPGYFFVIMSVVPKQSYFQGVSKLFTKFDRFDFLIPEFAEIGEQPVNSNELYVSDKPTIFGYQSRYSEYKFMFNEVHGDFRDTLSYWHDSRIFSSKPELTLEFLQVNSRQGLNRIFAYEGSKDVHAFNHIFSLLMFNIKALRPLPEYNNYRL